LAEVLLEYLNAVTSEGGKNYTARACGSETGAGRWQGWIEFVPLGEGDPIRSGRETTQPNRQDTIYWATGLTPVYLEGALRRALRPVARPPAPPREPPYFDRPAAPFVVQGSSSDAVLDPFSVYEKGEALLRRQLAALADWHLVKIIRRYGLSDEPPARLTTRAPDDLVEIIVRAVRHSSSHN